MYYYKDETLKWIKGLEYKYFISNKGNVYSASQWSWNGHTWWRKPFKQLKPIKHSNGYLQVIINRKHYYIHRLVAEHFIEIKNNCNQVNHKDENKQNNNVNNLEWVTAQYNMTYNDIHYRKWEVRNKDKEIWLCKNGKKVCKDVSVNRLVNRCKEFDKNASVSGLIRNHKSNTLTIEITPISK